MLTAARTPPVVRKQTTSAFQVPGLIRPSLGLLVFWCLLLGSVTTLGVDDRELPLSAAHVLVPVAAALYFVRGRISLPAPRTTFWLVLFCAWATLSAIWSMDPSRTMLSSMHLWTGAVVFVTGCAAYAGRSTMATWGLRVFGTLLTLQVVAAVAPLLASGSTAFYALKPTIRTPLGGSNFLAFFLNAGAIYECVLRARFWWLFAAVQVVGSMLTLSRAGVLALIGSLGVVVLVESVRGRTSRMLGAALVVAATVALVQSTVLGVVSLDALELIGRTADDRWELWAHGWAAFADRPVTGMGHATFEHFGGALRDVHSLPLAVLCETGLIGFSLVALLVATACREASTAAVGASEAETKRRIALGVAFVPVVLHSLVEPFFFSPAGAVWTGTLLGWLLTPSAPVRRGSCDRPRSA
jgi:O-antigen ligase